MAKLLLHTSTLTLRINGDFQFPTDKNSKTITIKNLIKLMEREPSAIEYLGYDFNEHVINKNVVENSVLVSIHVIEDPVAIDYQENDKRIITHFLKQVKKNTSRILIQGERMHNGKSEKQFELYVRGVADTSARSFRTLKHA